MKDNKPSSALDSCHKAMVIKYTDSLKQIGFDPIMEVGFWKIYNEVDRKLYLNCPELTKLVQKEYDGGKLKFSGEVISQKKLLSGLYEVIMKEVASNEIKTFLAKTPVDDNLINKYQPGYVLILEYEIIKNQQTNKDEYYLKADGKFSIMGVSKAATKE